MSWLRSHIRDENTRTYWDYTFQLTANHLTLEQSRPLKHSYDVLGEQCLHVLNRLNLAEQANRSTAPVNSESATTKAPEAVEDAVIVARSATASSKQSKKDLYALLQEHYASDPSLQRLWKEVNTIPEWVDWEQIARGQDVFYRYAGPMFVGLTYSSLLGGLGAHRVVEVLARTGGFSTRVARHRLYETTQFVLEVTRSLADIQPPSMNPEGGAGFKSCVRVRLLHAAVRQRILDLARTRPNYYSVALNGIPINDLDSIGTIGTFSAVLVFRALPRQGIFLREREIEDYLALWRLVAHYMGCPTSPYFESPQKSRVIMETLLMNEVDPSPTSRALASNIISSIANVAPAYPSRAFLESSARWCNGDEICDALGLGRQSWPWSWYFKALVAGQCFFFIGFCYFNRSFEKLDRRRIQELRRLCWAAIVDANYGLAGEMSVFEFRYIPEIGVLTGKEDPKIPVETSVEKDEKGNLRATEVEIIKVKKQRAREQKAGLVVALLAGVACCFGYLGLVGVKKMWNVLV